MQHRATVSGQVLGSLLETGPEGDLPPRPAGPLLSSGLGLTEGWRG